MATVDGRMRTSTSLTAAVLTVGHLANGPRVALINGDSRGQHLFRSKGAENVQIKSLCGVRVYRRLFWLLSCTGRVAAGSYRGAAI